MSLLWLFDKGHSGFFRKNNANSAPKTVLEIYIWPDRDCNDTLGFRKVVLSPELELIAGIKPDWRNCRYQLLIKTSFP